MLDDILIGLLQIIYKIFSGETKSFSGETKSKSTVNDFICLFIGIQSVMPILKIQFSPLMLKVLRYINIKAGEFSNF